MGLYLEEHHFIVKIADTNGKNWMAFDANYIIFFK